MIELACIGASWGGLRAVTTVLASLAREDLHAAVVIAQHRSADSQDGALPDLLGHSIPVPVRDASDKEQIEPGTIYIAPLDYHLLVENGSFALTTDERVQFARPSIDVLFETAAEAYGARMIGVILTGANADGAAGLRSVRERGGMTVVQDPATAERTAMPEAALGATDVDAVLPLDEIGPFLVRHCCGTREPVG